MTHDPITFTSPADPNAPELVKAALEMKAMLEGVDNPALLDAFAGLTSLLARGDTEPDDFLSSVIRVHALTLHATIGILIEMQADAAGEEAAALVVLIDALRGVYERVRDGDIRAFEEVSNHL